MDGKILKITLRPQHWHNTVRWFKKSRKWTENKETSHRILKEEPKHDTFLSTEAWGAEAANGLLNPSLSSVLSQRFLSNELLTDSISMFDYSEFEKYLVKTLLYMTSQYLGLRSSHTPGGAWVVVVWNTKVDQSGTLHWVHGLEMSWNAMKCLRSSCCSVALWCFAKKNREMVKTLTVVRAW